MDHRHLPHLERARLLVNAARRRADLERSHPDNTPTKKPTGAITVGYFGSGTKSKNVVIIGAMGMRD